MAVQDWDVDPLLNNTLEGVDVAEGCLPGGLNDMFRNMAAAIKTFYNNTYSKIKNVTIAASGGALPSSPAEGDFFLEY